MRESGFDPSRRFGPFNAGVTRYNPVCLNALLYVMELDLAEISARVGAGDPEGWRRRAAKRRQAVDRYLWDNARGLYLDYDFVTGERRDYPFATTFFPLWAEMASAEQAARIAANLPLFERAGGVVTSLAESGAQWDAPFGWAPLQLVAVEGLRRYGYTDAAERLSVSFLSLVLAEYLAHHAIFEKYDVVRRESAVAEGIRFGYSSNEVGFGWTNGVWLELFAALSAEARAEVARRAALVPVDGDR